MIAITIMTLVGTGLFMVIVKLLFDVSELKSHLDYTKDDLADLRKTIGEPKKNMFEYYMANIYDPYRDTSTTDKTSLIERIENIEKDYKEKVSKLEEYLKIKRVISTEKVDKYVKRK